jgi:hypothetical protein
MTPIAFEQFQINRRARLRQTIEQLEGEIRSIDNRSWNLHKAKAERMAALERFRNELAEVQPRTDVADTHGRR